MNPSFLARYDGESANTEFRVCADIGFITNILRHLRPLNKRSYIVPAHDFCEYTTNILAENVFDSSGRTSLLLQQVWYNTVLQWKFKPLYCFNHLNQCIVIQTDIDSNQSSVVVTELLFLFR